MKLYLIILFIPFAICTKTYAQSDTSETIDIFDMSLAELMQIKVSTSIDENHDLLRTNSSVTIIDKKMIDSFNFQTIQEALQTVAGFSVYRTYLKRDIPTSRGILQDHYANNVLILINGISSWHAVTGEGNLSRIDINDVERIEILRGPASGKYGTNAYSGVINIILKENNGQKGNCYIGAGSSLLGKTGGNIILKKEDFKLFASANYQYEKGNIYTFTDEVDSTGNIYEYMNIRNFSTLLSYKSHSLFLNAFDTDESYLGVVPSFKFGAGNNQDVRGAMLNYTFEKNFLDKINITYSSSFDWNNRNLSRSADDNIRTNIEGYRIFSKLSLSYNYSDNLIVLAGTDMNYLKCTEYKDYNKKTANLINSEFSNILFSGDNGMNNLNSTENTLFTGFILNRNKIGIDVLLRNKLSKKNNFENIYGNTTFVYKPNSKNSLKFITGRSYTSPTIFEQNFVKNTVLGNPNLKPEIGNTVELAYLTTFSNFYIQSLVYYSKYENKIIRAIGDTILNGQMIQDINIYQNGATFTAQGIETEVQYRNSNTLAFLNITYNYDNNDNIEFIPKYKISTGLSRRINDFIISSNANYMSKAIGFISEIEQQYMININLTYIQKRKKNTLKHSLFANNILNSDFFYPEYCRKLAVNEIPYGYRRVLGYTFNISFE